MPGIDPAAPESSGVLAQVDALVAALRRSVNRDPEPDKEALVALARGPEGSRVREHLESMLGGELLPVQWELEEVLEATAPPPAEPPAPAPAEEEAPEAPEDDADRPLTSADLNLVYDDPRGLMLHKTKKGERWFATQVDPRTGQPQTFELHPQEIQQLQQQLAGSPYWLIGG